MSERFSLNACFGPSPQFPELMLHDATKTFRWKAAALLAVLYALCVLTSSAAFAFGDSHATAHCLEEAHVVGDYSAQVAEAIVVGDHNGAPIHPAGDHDDGDCCGLFSIVALLTESVVLTNSEQFASTTFPVWSSVLNGRNPDGLIRPPIS